MSFWNLNTDFSTKEAELYKVLPHSTVNRDLIDHGFGSRLAEGLNLNMEKGPWLAGGAVRKLYLGQSIGESDWDIWFRSAQQFDIAHKYIASLGANIAYSSDNATTFKYYYEGETHQIQLIRRRFFETPNDVINQFDFSICQLLTDGDKLLLGKTTVQDLETRTIRLGSDRMQPHVVTRMVKYIVYGYYPTRELAELIEQRTLDINWKDGQFDYDAS